MGLGREGDPLAGDRISKSGRVCGWRGCGYSAEAEAELKYGPVPRPHLPARSHLLHSKTRFLIGARPLFFHHSFVRSSVASPGATTAQSTSSSRVLFP
jgi:hypothetical protein